MGSRTSPALIGGFVVGAMALFLGLVAILGSGQLSRHTTKAVCFFSGDINGLDVGAPVKFKGVSIGAVSDIRLRLKGEADELTAEGVAKGIRIPVVIEIDDEKLIAEGAQSVVDRGRLQQLIDFGLRAQLVSQSLLTGMLLVQLDFNPNTPAHYVMPFDSSIVEIPTIPTIVQQVQTAAEAILRKLEGVNMEELAKTAQEALVGVRDLTTSPGLRNALAELPETERELRQTIASLRHLITSIDRQQGPVLASLRNTSDKAGAAVDSAHVMFDRIDGMVGPQAPLMVDLASSLREIAGAARSLRLLTDYLERHPSSVVRGRYVGEEEK